MRLDLNPAVFNQIRFKSLFKYLKREKSDETMYI